jgi:hypothetical protein
LPDGECQEIAEEGCGDEGGTFQGPGTDCQTAACGPFIEIDVCETSQVSLNIGLPDGSIHAVDLSGPSTWETTFETTEGSAVDDTSNGLDEVETELVSMDLTGTNPLLGTVELRASSTLPSLGMIEERVNNTPGTLDVFPFTPSGQADVWVDVFFEIEFGGQVRFTIVPFELHGVINSKPPVAGESLVSPVTDVLLVNQFGFPTGFIVSGPVTYTCSPKPTAIELSSFAATPSHRKVTIEWSTGSEIDNLGFNLYRAESEDGEYIQINGSLMVAKGSPNEGSSYEFVDRNVRNRNTYWYKLEDVDIYGTRTQHGPISATPRLIYLWDRK